MSEESDVEKTEDPTPHRLEKAREEGQIPRSKELTSLLMLCIGWMLIWLSGKHLAVSLARMLQNGLQFNYRLIGNENMMLAQCYQLILITSEGLLPVLLGLFFTAIGSTVLIGGVFFNPGSIKFDLKRLNPLSGFKRMFSGQMLSETLKGVLKVVLAGCACWLYLRLHWDSMLILLHESPLIAIGDSLTLIAQCLMLVIISLIPMVGYDVFWQLTSHIKKLRMSRQEIRDEFKQQEGDPHVKGRIRQMQRAMAQKRMMADVPQADVIVNNPTHYSVALRYQEGKTSAPEILAKGAGEIALRIREIANEHHIPMLEAPPLARALYRHGDIGQPIPVALYSAVAEVLAWVYGLRRWRKEGGLIPRRPNNISVPSGLDFAQKSEK